MTARQVLFAKYGVDAGLINYKVDYRLGADFRTIEEAAIIKQIPENYGAQRSVLVCQLRPEDYDLAFQAADDNSAADAHGSVPLNDWRQTWN
jgi:hypothetical protein